MAQKKDRSRFTIKFRENDPAHDMTIRILENQGQRNITPFIVNAVLHYVQCSETPDMSYLLAEKQETPISRNMIEDIVKEILNQQGIIKDNSKKEMQKADPLLTEEDADTSVPYQNIMSEEMRSRITRTLSAFRKD